MRIHLRHAVALAVLGAACLAARARAGDEDKSAVKLSAVEQKLLDLTNEARKEAGLKPLRPNATLLKLARDHSANMAKQRKLDHVLDNKTPFQRMKEAGYRYYRGGENVAIGDNRIAPAVIFGGWMKSKFHRENILNPEFTEIGIGRATNADGEMYYTQVFAKPRR
jgi:uncharacterized protein YkwD